MVFILIQLQKTVIINLKKKPLTTEDNLKLYRVVLLSSMQAPNPGYSSELMKKSKQSSH